MQLRRYLRGMNLFCQLRGHHPDRKRVRHDGDLFHARCTRCGAPLVRLETGWIAEQAKNSSN